MKFEYKFKQSNNAQYQNFAIEESSLSNKDSLKFGEKFNIKWFGKYMIGWLIWIVRIIKVKVSFLNILVTCLMLSLYYRLTLLSEIIDSSFYKFEI